MRKIRYQVAVSLDGYLAGPKGEIDWIADDAEMDFGPFVAQFDALLVGRRTFEDMLKANQPTMPGMTTFLFSRTWGTRELPKNVQLVPGDHAAFVEELRSKPGKDIWLFGGGELFASLMADGLVDTVEVSVMPALVGGGVPLFPASGAPWRQLRLDSHKIYANSGILSLTYTVLPQRTR